LRAGKSNQAFHPTSLPTGYRGHALGRPGRNPHLRTCSIRAVGWAISSVRCAHPRGVSAWYNAYDTRDVVALYPLDADDFPVQPAITNYGKVRNSTDDSRL
jgi:hypothetical protein